MKKDEKEERFNPKILKVSDLPQFEHYHKYWAERPDLIKGELLSSWMIRTVLANMTDIYSLLEENMIQFKKIEYYIYKEEKIKEMNLDHTFEKYDNIFKRMDYIWIPELIEFFSKHTGFHKSKLKELSLCDSRQRFDESIKRKYSNQKFYKKLWDERNVYPVVTNLRVCPKCLKEDKIPYIRKIWQIIYMPICLSHRCFFEIRCPRCRLKISPYKLKENLNLRYCHNCKLDLSSPRPRYIVMDKNNYLKSITEFFQDKKKNIYEKISQVFVEIWKDDDRTKLFYLPIYYHNYPISKDNIMFNMVGKAIKKIK